VKGGVGTDLHLRLDAGLSEDFCKTFVWCTLINNHQLHIVYIYICGRGPYLFHAVEQSTCQVSFLGRCSARSAEMTEERNKCVLTVSSRYDPYGLGYRQRRQ